MEIIKKETQWFFSEDGVQSFHALQTLEDRSVFIYSYLKTVVNDQLEKDNLIFKTAFFLADALCGSVLAYANYPDVIDKTKNPFVAYLMNLKEPCSSEIVYCTFLAILQDLVNPFNPSEWIYSKEYQSKDKMLKKLGEMDRQFIFSGSTNFVDPADYQIDAALEPIQLKIIWMFYNTLK